MLFIVTGYLSLCHRDKPRKIKKCDIFCYHFQIFMLKVKHYGQYAHLDTNIHQVENLTIVSAIIIGLHSDITFFHIFR